MVNLNLSISCYKYDFLGTIDEATFLRERFNVNQQGRYEIFESGCVFEKSTLQEYWQNHTFYGGFHLLFVKRLSTERRLTSSNALQRNDQPERNPIYKLNQSESLAQKLSDYFRQAFGYDLIVNRNDMQTIPLHIGQAPDKTAFTIANQDEYYNQVNPQIANTVKNKSTNEFALFNNGITILSDDTQINSQVAKKDRAQLIITNPQIINGGQTAFTLSSLYEECIFNDNYSIFNEKEVLVKIITFIADDQNNENAEDIKQKN